MAWVTKEQNGIWTEYVNEDTGESSLRDIQPKTIKTFCEQHYFELPQPSSREAVCKKCGIGSQFNPGTDALEDGKLISLTH